MTHDRNPFAAILAEQAPYREYRLSRREPWSFLGLGPPPPTASLGEMVNNSSSLASFAWWTLAGPSIAIVVAVIGFNLLGDGLRDAADPRARTT